MAKVGTAEKMTQMIEDMHQEIRKDTVTDIIVDLRDILKGEEHSEYAAGLRAAIEMIESNY